MLEVECRKKLFRFNQIDWKRNCDDYDTLEDEFRGKDIIYILIKGKYCWISDENLFQDIKIKDWWIHGCQLFSGFRFSFTKRMQTNICEHLHVEILDKQRAKNGFASIRRRSVEYTQSFVSTDERAQTANFLRCTDILLQMLAIICDDIVHVRILLEKFVHKKYASIN